MRPRTGLAQVEDRAREARIVATVTSAVLTILHPRTAFSVNLQEMADDGCLESACVNAACLALLDASVSLKYLIASVSQQTIRVLHCQIRPMRGQLPLILSSHWFNYSLLTCCHWSR